MPMAILDRHHPYLGSRKTDKWTLEGLTLPYTKEGVSRYNKTRRKATTKHQGFKVCY